MSTYMKKHAYPARTLEQARLSVSARRKAGLASLPVRTSNPDYEGRHRVSEETE